MRNWTKIAVTALALVATEPAWAANCATVSFSPTAPAIPTWDPINGAQVQTTFTATVGSLTPGANRYRIIFLDNDSASPIRIGSGTTNPQYSIRIGGTDYAFPSTGTTAGNGIDNTAGTLTFTLAVPANTAARDYLGGTTYSEALRYTIECYNNGGSKGVDSLQSAVTLSLTIPKIVSITTASPQTIDFGSFTTTSQNLNVGLKSTSSVNVAVSTAKGGQMVLAGAVSPYPPNSVIPYTMTLNGVSVANGTNLTNQTRAGVAGATWPLVLTLTGGLPTGKIAGGYSDTITLTLTPGA